VTLNTHLEENSIQNVWHEVQQDACCFDECIEAEIFLALASFLARFLRSSGGTVL
jgi:hypothetical protein